MPNDFKLSEVAPLPPAPLPHSKNCLHNPDHSTKTLQELDHSIRLSGIVLIDMDNTMNDWDAQFRYLMHQYFPDINLIDSTLRKHYNIEANYPPQSRPEILCLTQLKGFWAGMPLAKGMRKAVMEMVAAGLDVYILSAPDERLTGRCASEKFEWVERNLGSDWKERVILCRDKTLVHGDVLIDDKPTVGCGIRSPTWKHVVFCQPYNCEIEAEGRLHEWADWYATIGPLVKKVLK